MTTSAPDTWAPRDLPVLVELVRRFEEGAWQIPDFELADTLGLDTEAIALSVRYLESAGLVEQTPVAQRRGVHAMVQAVTATGLERAGAWPTEETALDRIIAALEAIAANTDDEDTRSNAQKFAAWLRASASTVGLSVATAAITGQIPGT